MRQDGKGERKRKEGEENGKYLELECAIKTCDATLTRGKGDTGFDSS